jgi:GTP-binding protein
VLADLTEDEQRVVICRGGKGGKGNTFFKTSSNRTPRRALPGGEAIVLAARLELKLLADVGLLGFPNAGKSTLISVVSRARPRIADYPCTTLVPNLGMVSRGWEDGFVIADIPGLVQGAAQGVGLGHRFLRHVERSRFLLHLVSAVSEGEPVEDPMERYLALRAELAAFSEDLVQRPEVVVLTKADAVLEEELSALVDRFEAACGQRPHVISAVTRRGVDALMDTCWSRLQAMIETGDQD